MIITAIFFVFCFVFVHVDSQDTCGYQSCNLGDKNKLNVHLVPHTHDDVGWLKTVDQYFYGAHTEIQTAGVQYILDTVVGELQKSPSRRFIYVEIAFFYRWWNQQDDPMKQTVKNLVQQGRLEFILGGWCMNDEASTHYNAIIDQMSLGLRFLNSTFGPCARPRVAWQIDPFGHSREQASLFAQMGFDGLFFGRLDFDDKSLREKEKRMEEIWRGSQSLSPPIADLLTGVNQNGYGPPKGFCFDELCQDPPIMDDPRLEDYNVDEKVKEFRDAAIDQARHYRTNHIMMTMGSDFQYSNALHWFKNVDKLIKHVNEAENLNISVFYSTPSCYLYALNTANLDWTVKTDDFFPYADAPHNYWTGYFTSRPALKGYERETNKFLQACRQLQTLSPPKLSKRLQAVGVSTEKLEQAMGVAQHHDAVSGTEKQHVANDYAKRLYLGREGCKKVISTSVSGQPDGLQFCDYLNITLCKVTEQSHNFVTMVYNPLARPVSTYVRLPINDDGGFFTVTDLTTKKIVTTQIIPTSEATMSVRRDRGNANSELVFAVNLPALGFGNYQVTKSNYTSLEGKKQMHRSVRRKVSGDLDIIVQTIDRKMTVGFDARGWLSLIYNTEVGITTHLKQEVLWYNASTGNSHASNQPSGAYIFRPNSSIPFTCTESGKIELEVLEGENPLVKEIYQKFSDWAWQVIRLYTGHKHVEVEWTIGPIPFEDGLGKEVISRYNISDMATNGEFYTDSNGREMLLRKINYRPSWKLNQSEPVAGNYYPVNSRISINDSRSSFTLLTDRSQGGASLGNGSLEVMLHRRLFVDDSRGVAEALNETGQFDDGLIVRGKQYLITGNSTTTQRHQRLLSEETYMSPLISFHVLSDYKDSKFSASNYSESGLTRDLPKNVHLLTLMTDGEYVTIRLEHQFQTTDDPELSKPVTVALKGLFVNFDPVFIEELALGGNALLKDIQRLKWTAQNQFDNYGYQDLNNGKIGDDFSISLNPMQIRTFRMIVKYK